MVLNCSDPNVSVIANKKIPLNKYIHEPSHKEELCTLHIIFCRHRSIFLALSTLYPATAYVMVKPR